MLGGYTIAASYAGEIEIMVLQVKEIGLAAFMQMGGCTLKTYDKSTNTLYLEAKNDKTLDEWAVDYSNSCCSQHDRNILTLRNLVRNSKR